MTVDRIVIGAGLYGLYSALYMARRGKSVLVLERDEEAFKRATYINQARVHMGYHYPRSLSTALKSANYYDRFNEDYGFCINGDFTQVYATSTQFSWTDAREFMKFCESARIKCDPIHPEQFFVPSACDGAFVTREVTYDAKILRDFFLQELKSLSPKVSIIYNARIMDIRPNNSHYRITLNNGDAYETDFVLNATYASTNEILDKAGEPPFNIKYELCEIILCRVSENINDVGITVMDGPFFSLMPFGKTGYHSLTSVSFTPHDTSYDILPTFSCQTGSNGFCTPGALGNCNDCSAKPESAWKYMSALAHKYLRDDISFKYVQSLYSMKPILKTAEIDDSRPTVIRSNKGYPRLISVLSGKINTVYDLDEYLED